MKKIAILGSTGSIGRSALEVAQNIRSEVKVLGLTANKNIHLLADQIEKFKPQIVAIADKEAAKRFSEQYTFSCQVLSGLEGIIKVATMAEVDTVVTALVGAVGLIPTIEAIKAGKNIALANKETLVAAGELVMGLIEENKIAIMPIDSEHSALHQALHHRKNEEIKRLIITASGGPFWQLPKEEFKNITVEQALNHPTWSMGAKITIDSATMMNKGLEVIEAHWLFGIPLDKIEVAIHPQSIIHSMVEFVDGSIMAQMSYPDMRIPIQYALTYPDHLPASFVDNNLFKINTLTFEQPDFDKYPCLELAYFAVKEGGIFPAVMNAVNEMAIQAFLSGKIPFTEIPVQITEILQRCDNKERPTLEDILEADEWARETWKEFYG